MQTSYISIRCKTRTRRDVITFSETEIDKIRKVNLPSKLNTARDWLLISCYTGQRFSDFMRFSSNLVKRIGKRECLQFYQVKTGKEILLPLHPLVKEIINRNKGDFPAKLSLTTYNTEIRLITKKALLLKKVKAGKRIGHRSYIREIEKWQAVSSHIGRRSFATNFYGKIPTPLLMDATGHSSEKMFLKYIKPIDSERIARLGSYFDKTFKYKDTVNI